MELNPIPWNPSEKNARSEWSRNPGSGKRPFSDITSTQDPDIIVTSARTLKQREIGESFVGFGSLVRSGMLTDVDVYVGPNKQHFALHKVVLSLNSGYFRCIFSPTGFRFKEGRGNKIEFPEQRPFAFKHIVHWLYHGKMLQSSEEPKVWSICVYTDIIRTANYFDIPSLRNAAIVGAVESIREHHEYYLPNGACRKHFTRAIKDIVELYCVEGWRLDLMLSELHRFGFFKDMLEDKEMRELLREERDLTMRMLDIQAGLP